MRMGSRASPTSPQDAGIRANVPARRWSRAGAARPPPPRGRVPAPARSAIVRECRRANPAANASPAPLAPAICACGTRTDAADEQPAVARHHHAAAREMHHDKLHRAGRERRARGGDAGGEIGAPGLHRGDAGDAANLVVVDDEQVEMRQARAHQRGSLLRRDADQLQIGEQPGRPRLLQRRDPAVRLALPRRVHDPVHAGQAEVEDPMRRLREIEMRRASAARSCRRH